MFDTIVIDGEFVEGGVFGCRVVGGEFFHVEHFAAADDDSGVVAGPGSVAEGVYEFVVDLGFPFGEFRDFRVDGEAFVAELGDAVDVHDWGVLSLGAGLLSLLLCAVCVWWWDAGFGAGAASAFVGAKLPPVDSSVVWVFNQDWGAACLVCGVDEGVPFCGWECAGAFALDEPEGAVFRGNKVDWGF